MADEKQGKCANPISRCIATPDSRYCSAPCERAKGLDITVIGCGCSHPGCAGHVTA